MTHGKTTPHTQRGQSPVLSSSPCLGEAPPSHKYEAEDQERDMIELRIYLDGTLRKIVAITGGLMMLMAIVAYLYQFFK